jgi:hypothetical protein
MEWLDSRTGRTWRVAVSSHGNGWLEGRPVRILWFARDQEFWSTECYLAGQVEELSVPVLQEHLDRARKGWFQGVGTR